MIKLSYRQDLDGLRALAIIPVVLFHAYPSLIKGGFIGVDIFFVISGYLITSIIIDKIENNNFNFKNFYARRILRIFPSLMAVLLTLLAIGYFFLLPEDYESLAKHIFRATTFTSNFLLLNETGYFDISSNLKPLLHLWSLSIEEQFYIFFPFLIWYLYKKKYFIIALLFVFVLSFLASIIFIKINPTATFYSPFTRFWELIAGSLVACRGDNRNPLKLISAKGIYRDILNINVISWIGFLLIILGFFTIPQNQKFPGWHALIPVIGTVLLIVGGPNSWLSRKILSLPIIVFIGLLSYPLYLWHWPIISLLNIWIGEKLTNNIITSGLLLSLILAYYSRLWIEMPIRFGLYKNKSFVKYKLLFLILCFILIGFASYYVKINKGIINRFHISQGILEELKWPESNNWTEECRNKFPGTQYCKMEAGVSSPTAVLIGDSHANHFYFGLHNWYASQGLGELINLGRSGCGVFIGVDVGIPSYSCYEQMKPIFDYVMSHKEIKTVYLSFYHEGYFEDKSIFKDMEGKINYSDRYLNIEASLLRTINQFKNNGKIVVLIQDLPNINLDPKQEIKLCLYAEIFNLNQQCNLNNIKLSYTDSYKKYVRLISSVKAKTDVFIINPNEYLDNNFPLDIGGNILYRDKNHLSERGSLYFVDKYKMY